MSAPELRRFTLAQRLTHWVVGLSFALLLATGFAFSYPSLFWMTMFVGGGASARVLHPWIGLTFSAGLGWMFVLWVREMFLDDNDRRWLLAIKHYARHETDKVPPTGKYNGGQKLFFWTQSVLGVVLLLSGVSLWRPDGLLGLGPFASGLLQTMRLLHYLAALGGGLFLIIHVYLGIVAYPGTARGMIDGKVSRRWARLHHPLWHDEQTER